MCSASVCVWNSSKCSNVNIFGPFGSWLLAGTGRTQTCKQSNLLSARLLPRHFAPECAHIMWNISWAHAATTGTTKTKKRKNFLIYRFAILHCNTNCIRFCYLRWIVGRNCGRMRFASVYIFVFTFTLNTITFEMRQLPTAVRSIVSVRKWLCHVVAK